MGRKLFLAITGAVVFTSRTAAAAALAAGADMELPRRDMPRGFRARHAITAIGLLMAFGAVPQIAEADLAPFATANATCNGFNTAVSFPPVSSAHGDVVYALSSTGASGEDDSDFVFGSDGGGFFPQFQPGDTVWSESQPVQAGTAPTLSSIECTGGTISVSLYDRPTPPFTLSGVSTGSGTVSDLPFQVLNAGQYVVDASLSQGAIDFNEDLSGFASGCFSDNSPCETIAGSGEYSLGALAAGSYDLPIDGLAGPAASWALAVRELPVQLSGLAFASPYLQPGTADSASFSISGTTQVAGRIDNSAGQDVDDLGSFTAFYAPGGPDPGQSGITWGGRGNGGATLPDGTYTLVLTSTDPNGNVSMTQTPVLVDGTPPSVAMTSPATISPSQSVSFAVADAGSGVASISVDIDGQDVADYGTYEDALPANGTVTISPDQTDEEAPWSLGEHSWAIVATDNAGNAANITGAFTVQNPSPTVHTPPVTQPTVRIPVVPTFDGAPYDGRGLARKPAQIVYTGDGTGVWAGARAGKRRYGPLRWTTWTATQAVATGYDWVDNCNPDCAGGRFTGYPIKLILSKPQYEHGHEVFTHAEITYTRKRPPHVRRQWSMVVTYGSGGFNWGS
jgi:hypothetical protein